ncbi:MAG: glycosyltransferase family 2 protein [Candidatus Hodarchaeota archaeon]
MIHPCFTLDDSYATTRLLTTQRPTIRNNPDSKLQTALFLPPNPGRKGEWGLRTKGYFKQGFKEKPLVSVITVVLNGERHLEKTIQSVISQTYDNLEYIIIDGGSTDSTLDIIAKYENTIDYCVSEADEGISDAFNKGITCSLGQLIGIINSDDWYEQDAVSINITNFDRIACFSFGICTYIKSNGEKVDLLPDQNYHKKIKYWMPQIHTPTVFVKKRIYQTFGLFDYSLKYAMDYDFFLRLYKNNCVGTALPNKIAYMRMQGASNKFYFEVRREVRKISIRYGVSPPVAHICCMLLLLKYILYSKNKW